MIESKKAQKETASVSVQTQQEQGAKNVEKKTLAMQPSEGLAGVVDGDRQVEAAAPIDTPVSTPTKWFGRSTHNRKHRNKKGGASRKST